MIETFDIVARVAEFSLIGGLVVGGLIFSWLLLQRVNPWKLIGLCLILSTLAIIASMLAITTAVFAAKLLAGFLTAVACTGFMFASVGFMVKDKPVKMG